MQQTAKQIANLLAMMVALVPYVGYRIISLIVGRQRAFPGWSQLLSLLPGHFGNLVRGRFYLLVLPACGRDVCISFGTVFSHPTATLGDRVYVGIGCMIGDVTLEDDVLISSHVSIINGRRQHGTERLDIPVREQPGEYPRIIVGRDSWIGERAVVAADIGRQAIVGAAAVVINQVDDLAIVAGNPARVRGFRGQERGSAPADVANDSAFVALKS